MSRRTRVLAPILILTLLWPSSPALGKERCSCSGENRPLVYTSPPLHGQDVMELQFRLAQLGYYFGPLTGVYDWFTFRAVTNFQRHRGLPVSGVVNSSLWEALRGDIHPTAQTTNSGPPPGSNLKILVDTEKLRLYLLVDGQVFREYPIAIGKYSTPSPVGEWKIREKSYEAGGPLGTRWLGLNVPWGNYGIHGTNRPWSIGWPASAGCFRMFNEDIEEMFPWIPLGTPVIVKGPYTPPSQPLKPGLRGPEVVSLQARLREKGFYLFGPTDGDYGTMTSLAIKQFQLAQGLKPTGIADKETLEALGFNLPPE